MKRRETLFVLGLPIFGLLNGLLFGQKDKDKGETVTLTITGMT